MKTKKIRVAVYSDDADASLITASLHQISLDGIELSIIYPEKFMPDGIDLSIAKIQGKDSRILDQLIQNRDRLMDKLLFVLDGKDMLLAPILAKLGFNDIYIFPDELFQFTAYTQDIIERMSVKDTPDYTSFSIESVIGSGSNSEEKILIARKAAETPSINLLIRGESGTGKGLLSSLIHSADKVSTGSFIEVICTAIPDALLESELFGYEKGAFTDAKTKKPGLFELAENGTLFLDEIGDLNLGLQAKLLKVIEKKTFRRLGGVEDIPLKSRIISATNRDLPDMIKKKLFRLDLYYRLSVVSIKLEPLRNRKEEIIPQAEFLISKFAKEYNKPPIKADRNVKDFMYEYSWPGNLREFRNTIEMAVLMLEGKKMTLNYFKNFIQNYTTHINEGGNGQPADGDFITLNIDHKKTDLNSLIKQYVQEVLAINNNNKSKTAKILGISRPRLLNLLSD